MLVAMQGSARGFSRRKYKNPFSKWALRRMRMHLNLPCKLFADTDNAGRPFFFFVDDPHDINLNIARKND